MHIEHYTDETAFEQLATEWEALHAQSSTATIFNSPTWCCTWWRHFGGLGRLHVVAARTESGQLVGLAPLVVTVDREQTPPQPVIRFVGRNDLCDYLDILIAPGYEEAVVEHFIDAWLDLSCECELDLHTLPHTSPLLRTLPVLGRQRGLVVTRTVQDVCPVIPLPGTWSAYLEHLEAKSRRELRRKLRQAGQRAFTSWYYVTCPDQVAEDLPTFFALHRSSGPEKAAFLDDRRENFFREVVPALASKGWVWLAFLQVNGQPAAAYLCFDFRGEVQVYNSGLDPALATSLSPGWILLGYLIEHAIHLGYRRFNFLRGDEEYKFQFGARSEPVYHLRVVSHAQEAVR